jgi:CRP/FNR family transcriptional regulator, cyclic AMP receptor protein
MDRSPIPPPRDPVRSALAACAPLSGLPASALDVTAERAWMRTLSPDEAVYRAGDPGDAMFVVASGRIAVRLQSPDGDAVDMAAVRHGELFGHLELFDGGLRSTDAVALAASRVVVVGAAASAQLLASSSDLVLALARNMARMVRTQVDARHEQAFYPVPARLARFLLAAADSEEHVRLEGPQALLAQRLGVARQTVSRALHDLVIQGSVTVDPSGRAVTIIDRPGLAVVADVRTRRGRTPRSGRGAQTTENPSGNDARPVIAASSAGPRPSSTATRAASEEASASAAGPNATSNPVAVPMSPPCTTSSKVRVGR